MDKISYWSQTAKVSQGAIYAHHSGDITDGTGGAWEYIDRPRAAPGRSRRRCATSCRWCGLYSGFGQASTLDAVNDLQAGFMVVPAVGVGEVHEVSQVHTQVRPIRAESRGVAAVHRGPAEPRPVRHPRRGDRRHREGDGYWSCPRH